MKSAEQELTDVVIDKLKWRIASLELELQKAQDAVTFYKELWEQEKEVYYLSVQTENDLRERVNELEQQVKEIK